MNPRLLCWVVDWLSQVLERVGDTEMIFATVKFENDERNRKNPSPPPCSARDAQAQAQPGIN